MSNLKLVFMQSGIAAYPLRLTSVMELHLSIHCMLSAGKYCRVYTELITRANIASPSVHKLILSRDVLVQLKEAISKQPVQALSEAERTALLADEANILANILAESVTADLPSQVIAAAPIFKHACACCDSFWCCCSLCTCL